MGAHALGGAKKSQSGFNGYWTKGEKTRFDEKFYANMIDKEIDWKNVVSFYFIRVNCNFVIFVP